MNKPIDPLSLDGRLFDGNAYCITVKDEGVVRVCDHDGPEGVWARINEALRKGPNEVVVFSGARSVANGKVDGMAFFRAGDILRLRNWGPSVVGAGSVEARILKLEEEQANMGMSLGDYMERVNDLENDMAELLPEEPENPDGLVEVPGPGGEVVPLPVPPEEQAALTAARDDEEG